MFYNVGCFEKQFNYIDGQTNASLPTSQIQSLIELSEYCEQSFYYECTLAPLTDENVDYAFWEDRHGGINNYFTGKTKKFEINTYKNPICYYLKGSNYGFHVCDCYYDSEGCVEPDISERCNCDANLPIPMSDSGTITNTTALPVMKLSFGGLTYDLESGAFQLGRLKCYGLLNFPFKIFS